MAGGTKQAGFVALLVAFVVPPAVAGGLGQRFVALHPGWAVAIGVAYEALVAVGGFFAVIARDVSSRWQTRFADRIDLFLQRKASRFERHYREFVLGSLRFMDHKGLATVGPFTPELDAVFVNVSLVPRPPQQIGPGVLPDLPADRFGRRVLGDFVGHKKPAVLAVVGSPGSGKTTLLRHAARQASLRTRSRKDRIKYIRNVPILLYLRDHADAITSEPAISLAALLRSTLGAAGTEEPPGWFEQQLRDGRCLVLLDGLDEVARKEDRVKVSAWAEGQVRQYPGNDFVISSRPQGYQSAPVEGADIVQVCGFTASQAEAFIRGWYRAIERHSTGSSDPEVEALAEKGANDILQRLEQAPALYDLTVNPLLLTMIANVHRYRGALPGSRADLYSEICQVMLWRRQDAKNLAQPIGGDKKEAILRGLAYTMMKQRVSDLSRTDVLTEIQPALRRASRSVTPDGFLAEVSSNGLLIERETGQYAFAHKTFQEYLAAAHIRDKGLAGYLAATVSDDWWAETTLLYAATANADPIVRACLTANSAPALALALDCTEQDSDVDPDLRAQVNALVIAAAESVADQERRRLFAGILLSRHMRQRERTTTGVQVCPRPIPTVIYRLFLADTQTPEPDTPLPESATATGMRSMDAAAFAQWATAVSGGQQGYRLPLIAELDELVSRHRIFRLPDGRPPCTWVQGDQGSSSSLPVLWVPPGTPDPYALTNIPVAKAGLLDAARNILTLTVLLLWSRFQIRAFTLGLDVDSALALARAQIIDTRSFDLNLGHVLDFAHVLALDLTLSPAPSPARGVALARATAADLARRLDLDLHPGLDLARRLIQALDFSPGPDFGPDLDRALELAHELAVSIDATVDRYLLSKPSDGPNRSVIEKICRVFMGRAFSDAITESLRGSSQPEVWTAHFASAFIDASGVEGAGHLTVDPATIAATLQDVVNKLADVLKEKQAAPPEWSSWQIALANRLRDNARRVFARVEPPTAEKAAAIRIAALCLAAEADDMVRHDIGDQFRQVAAGITLLERRVTGKQQAVEMIMLAVE
jgi:hypothetical protein